MTIQLSIQKLLAEKKRIIGNAEEAIRKEVKYVDIKPYSHNIINLWLREVATKVGKDDANMLIDKFHLERRGWKKE